MLDYNFVFINLPKNISEEVSGRVMAAMAQLGASNKDNITEEFYKTIYEKAMFIAKLSKIDVSGVFEFHEITDPETQNLFCNELKSNLSRNLENILASERLKTESFTILHEDKKVIVNYEKDNQVITEYFIDVLNSGCAYVWDEFNSARAQYVDNDVAAMEKLYKELRSWNTKELEVIQTKLEEYHKANNTSDIHQKYFPIIAWMSEFGFRSNIFRECVDHAYMNRSKTRPDIAIRYFKRALPKKANYRKQLDGLINFINEFEEQVMKESEEYKAKKKEIEAMNVEGRKGFYSNLI